MSQRHPYARSLALLAPIGAVLFTVAWFVLGFVSTGYQLFDLVIEPYSAVSQPISGLGLGQTALWMNAAFIVGGALVTAGMVGVGLSWQTRERKRSRSVALILLSATGIGMVICGVFNLEAISMHMVGFVLAVVLPLIGFVVAGYALQPTFPRVSTMMYIAGPLTLVLLVAFMVIFDPYAAGENVGVAGLVQRALTTVVLGAVAALGVVARRMPLTS